MIPRRLIAYTILHMCRLGSSSSPPPPPPSPTRRNFRITPSIHTIYTALDDNHLALIAFAKRTEELSKAAHNYYNLK